MIQTNNLGLIKHPIEVQIENKKIENEKKKAEEQRQKELEKKEEPEWQEFVLTYYGLLHSECGKTDGITASGMKISRGMIASPPQLKFGTKIIIEGNEYVVEDRGSSKYIKVNNDGSIRLDVYLERLNGESDREYYNRIQSKGVKRLKGYIVKESE
jgi:3D (Asp-Asp-Asp) domain-containing protein